MSNSFLVTITNKGNSMVTFKLVCISKPFQLKKFYTYVIK